MERIRSGWRIGGFYVCCSGCILSACLVNSKQSDKSLQEADDADNILAAKPEDAGIRSFSKVENNDQIKIGLVPDVSVNALFAQIWN